MDARDRLKGYGVWAICKFEELTSVLPEFEIDGIDDDHVGRMWGTFCKYVHATPTLAVRRAFSNDDQNDFKLGPRSPRNPDDLHWFKEGIAFLNKAAADYIAAIDHLFPVKPSG